jgi:hypothetical protein
MGVSNTKAITQKNIDDDNYYSKKGDVLIRDKDRAKQIYDEVLGTQQPKGSDMITPQPRGQAIVSQQASPMVQALGAKNQLQNLPAHMDAIGVAQGAMYDRPSGQASSHLNSILSGMGSQKQPANNLMYTMTPEEAKRRGIAISGAQNAPFVMDRMNRDPASASVISQLGMPSGQALTKGPLMMKDPNIGQTLLGIQNGLGQAVTNGQQNWKASPMVQALAPRSKTSSPGIDKNGRRISY